MIWALMIAICCGNLEPLCLESLHASAKAPISALISLHRLGLLQRVFSSGWLIVKWRMRWKYNGVYMCKSTSRKCMVLIVLGFILTLGWATRMWPPQWAQRHFVTWFLYSLLGFLNMDKKHVWHMPPYKGFNQDAPMLVY